MTTWVSRQQKGKPFWILMKQEMMGGSGIIWTICKSFAPRSRQITMPVPHHLVFTGGMPFLLPNQQHQSTESNTVNTDGVSWLRLCQLVVGMYCAITRVGFHKGSWTRQLLESYSSLFDIYESMSCHCHPYNAVHCLWCFANNCHDCYTRHP